jgi:hypothetical protein
MLMLGADTLPLPVRLPAWELFESTTIEPPVTMKLPLPFPFRAFDMVGSSRRMAGLDGEEMPRATVRAVTAIVPDPHSTLKQRGWLHRTLTSA